MFINLIVALLASLTTYFSISSSVASAKAGCDARLAALDTRDAVEGFQVQSVKDATNFLETVTLKTLRAHHSLSRLETFGLEDTDIFHALYRGQKVAAKFPEPNFTSPILEGPLTDRKVHPVVVESAYLKLLSDLGFGPKFYGIAKHHGFDAMVMEEVEKLMFVKHGVIDPAGISLTPAQKTVIKNQLCEIFAAMNERQIAMRDFQFIVTPEWRVVVVDPQRWGSFRSQDRKFPHKPGAALNKFLLEQALQAIDQRPLGRAQ